MESGKRCVSIQSLFHHVFSTLHPHHPGHGRPLLPHHGQHRRRLPHGPRIGPHGGGTRAVAGGAEVPGEDPRRAHWVPAEECAAPGCGRSVEKGDVQIGHRRDDLRAGRPGGSHRAQRQPYRHTAVAVGTDPYGAPGPQAGPHPRAAGPPPAERHRPERHTRLQRRPAPVAPRGAHSPGVAATAYRILQTPAPDYRRGTPPAARLAEGGGIHPHRHPRLERGHRHPGGRSPRRGEPQDHGEPVGEGPLYSRRAARP